MRTGSILIDYQILRSTVFPCGGSFGGMAPFGPLYFPHPPQGNTVRS